MAEKPMPDGDAAKKGEKVSKADTATRKRKRAKATT
jgi:hypothetical protein